ncbi:Gfo/Idh/MocA family protein [Paenibacillus sabuli]|uniref:Gfo/Idh/MocA family protein n=1 Tax=Paenibacillus sabuli TaxID=2772509 RepID=UPI001CC323B9|nr:Gfo/Idh/MocA family oxidoreductase [Paenibacillus sabuli]
MTGGTRIKIAQIGIGHNHASERMNTLRKLDDVFEVVGVVEDDPRWRAERGHLEAYAGLRWLTEEELLRIPGLQAVAVETDGHELVPTALRCVRAGLHVHLDKPGGESLPLFRELLDEAAARGLTVQLGYMYRSNPAVEFCFKAVREGWLGEIFEVHAVMSRYDGDEYRKWLSGFRGGAFYIFGCHMIDLVVRMLGRPDRILPLSRRTRPETDNLIDSGFAVFEYPKAIATIRTSVIEVEGYSRRHLVVCGDRGTIEIRPLEPPQLRLALDEPRHGYEAGYQDVELPQTGGRYDAQMYEFAAIVRGELDNPYPLEHEWLVQESLLRACGYPVDEPSETTETTETSAVGGSGLGEATR